MKSFDGICRGIDNYIPEETLDKIPRGTPYENPKMNIDTIIWRTHDIIFRGIPGGISGVTSDGISWGTPDRIPIKTSDENSGGIPEKILN